MIPEEKQASTFMHSIQHWREIGMVANIGYVKKKSKEAKSKDKSKRHDDAGGPLPPCYNYLIIIIQFTISCKHCISPLQRFLSTSFETLWSTFYFSILTTLY